MTKSYDVMDIIKAEYNLEPLKCRHCEAIGTVVYHQYIGDGYCEQCGNWQLEVN